MSPRMVRNRVDFPQPLGPIKAVDFPLSRERSIDFSAGLLPKLLLMPLSSTIRQPEPEEPLTVARHVPVSEAGAEDRWAGCPRPAAANEVCAAHVVLAVAVVGERFEPRIGQKRAGCPLPHVACQLLDSQSARSRWPCPN